MAPPEVKQQEETIIEDEPPLEMDINFDSSAESVQTEDNLSLEDNYDMDDTEEEVVSDALKSGMYADEVPLENGNKDIIINEDNHGIRRSKKS